MYIQPAWGNKLGEDSLSEILSFLPLDDVAHARPCCRTWSSNRFGQRSLLLGRLADLLVARIKKAHHKVPAAALKKGFMLSDNYEERAPFPTTTVDVSLDGNVFELLFGRLIAEDTRELLMTGAASPENPVKVDFKKPTDVLDALPSLPPVVFDVDCNLPTIGHTCPLRCWAGYADGHVQYDPAGSKFTLVLRSKVLKLSGYWEKTLEGEVMQEYLEDPESPAFTFTPAPASPEFSELA